MALEENFNPRVDPTYREQLLALADSSEQGAQLVGSFDTWDFADLPKQPGETIPYVRLGNTQTADIEAKPILFVPGFTGGILNKAPLAVDLAGRGHEVIVPGQNRTGLLTNSLGKKDATLTQAENYLAVLRAEGLDASPGSVDIVTHSYGALIFDAMHKLAEQRSLPCFKDTRIVMLDPAGFIGHEWLLRLGWGFGRNAIAETFSQKELPDSKGITLKAGIGYALANKPRTAREVWEISRRRVDYERLLRSDIGQLAVVNYAGSRIFPSKAQRKTMAKLFETEDAIVPVTWSTPIASQPNADGTARSHKDATHNDEQFNPKRVGAAVSQLLQLA